MYYRTDKLEKQGARWSVNVADTTAGLTALSAEMKAELQAFAARGMKAFGSVFSGEDAAPRHLAGRVGNVGEDQATMLGALEEIVGPHLRQHRPSGGKGGRDVQGDEEGAGEMQQFRE